MGKEAKEIEYLYRIPNTSVEYRIPLSLTCNATKLDPSLSLSDTGVSDFEGRKARQQNIRFQRRRAFFALQTADLFHFFHRQSRLSFAATITTTTKISIIIIITTMPTTPTPTPTPAPTPTPTPTPTPIVLSRAVFFCFFWHVSFCMFCQQKRFFRNDVVIFPLS